jgi:hypothetical protein
LHIHILFLINILDSNYNDITDDNHVTPTYIEYELEDVFIKTDSLKYSYKNIESSDNNISKGVNDPLTISGSIINKNDNPVTTGTIYVIMYSGNYLYESNSSNLSQNGSFSLTIDNIYLSGTYYLSYKPTQDYISRNYLDEFYVDIVKQSYNMTLNRRTNNYTDYQDGIFTFELSLDVEITDYVINKINREIDSTDGQFTFTFYDQNTTTIATTIPADKFPVIYNLQNSESKVDTEINRVNNTTTATFTFNPLHFGLNAGVYDVLCSFSGITNYLNQSTIWYKNFEIQKTTPTISSYICARDYYIDVNGVSTGFSTGFSGASIVVPNNSITEFTINFNNNASYNGLDSSNYY